MGGLLRDSTAFAALGLLALCGYIGAVAVGVGALALLSLGVVALFAYFGQPLDFWHVFAATVIFTLLFGRSH